MKNEKIPAVEFTRKSKFSRLLKWTVKALNR